MRAPTRHGPAAGDVANLHPMRCPAAGSPSEFSAGQRPALTRRECYGRPGPETSRVFIRKRRMPEPSRCPARCRRRRRFSPEASDAGARPPRLAIRAPAAEWLGVQFHDADQSRAWRLGGTQLGAGGNSHRRPEAGDPGEGLAASDTMIPSPVRGELRPSGAVMAVAQGTSAQGGYCQEGCSSQCRCLGCLCSLARRPSLKHDGVQCVFEVSAPASPFEEGYRSQRRLRLAVDVGESVRPPRRGRDDLPVPVQFSERDPSGA
jgi:hypothetical protein